MAKIDPKSMMITIAEQVRDEMNNIIKYGFSDKGKPVKPDALRMLKMSATRRLTEELEYAIYKGDYDYVEETLISISELAQLK